MSEYSESLRLTQQRSIACSMSESHLSRSMPLSFADRAAAKIVQVLSPFCERIEIAGSIQHVQYDTYSSVGELSTQASVSVTWTLTDLRTDAAVYDSTQRGAAKGPHEDVGVVVEAVRGSLRKVLADDSFITTVSE